MISVENKILCCGCEACSQICPKNAIIMLPDKEGFLYPKVDLSICINCGACNKVCPIINEREKKGIINAYALQAIDKSIREISTAGGAFFLIAKRIIASGGIVFGALISENNVVQHAAVDDIAYLEPLCMSKYVQSRINQTYKLVKESLKRREVMFVGTPCQCTALVNYLNGKPSNLLLVDFLCHGVPSPKVWRKYTERMINKYSAKNFQFRNKTYGYDKTGIAFRTKSGDLIHSTTIDDKEVKFMLKAFFAEICSRPSCHSCKFKGYERVTDLTLGDLWHIERFDKYLNDNLGTTFVATHTKKGEEILERLADARLINIPYKEYVNDDGVNLLYSMSPNSNRKSFFEDLDKDNLLILYDKYLSKKKNPIKSFLKVILSKFGVLYIFQRLNYRQKENKYIKKKETKQ